MFRIVVEIKGELIISHAYLKYLLEDRVVDVHGRTYNHVIMRCSEDERLITNHQLLETTKEFLKSLLEE